MSTLRETWKALHGYPEETRLLDVPMPSIECSDPERLCADPLVSIVVLIYNHEAYLPEALQSVCAQRTNFPYEILLCEDCSPDHSRDLCFACQKAHPEKVRVLTAEKNFFQVGGNNFFRGIKLARGRYISLLEGDDAWIDSQKLQKQVDLLQRTGASFCAAWNDNLIHQTGAIEKLIFPAVTHLDQVAPHVYYHTSTYVFTKKFWDDILPTFVRVPFYDTTLFELALSYSGGVVILPEVVSFYRQTGKGIYTGATLTNRALVGIRMFTSLMHHGPSAGWTFYRRSWVETLFHLAIGELRESGFTKRACCAAICALGHIFVLPCAKARFLFGSLAKSFLLALKPGKGRQDVQ